MSSKRHLRHKQCDGKIRYGSMNEAIRASSIMSYNKDARMSAYHSSKRNHPAMAEEMETIADAYNFHCENHDALADFEVCPEIACHLAVLLEKAYGWL